MSAVAVSILSCNNAYLGDAVKAANAAQASHIHIDIIDSAYGGNFSFGPKTVYDLKKISNIPVEVHLEIFEPQSCLDLFFDARPDMITIQSDSCPYVLRVLESIKKQGVKAGIGFNPVICNEQMKYYIAYADYIILLCVEPGLGRQRMTPFMYDKVKAVRTIMEEEGVDIPVFVDGGVNEQTAPMLLRYGADALIIGSGIFTKNDISREEIELNIRKYENISADV